MRITPLFQDRAEAGRTLAHQVMGSGSGRDAVVLALPRGGVPVGFEVAMALHAEFDVFLVRKLGLPGQEELAIGAIASGGVQVLNEALVRELGVTEDTINRVAERERHEMERRECLYREDRAPVPVANRTVILVDDGLATGATMRAAIKALRQKTAARVVAAVPVAPAEVCDELRGEADEVICATSPEPFVAVGLWYESFPQTTDEEVRLLLEQAASRATSGKAL